MFYKLCVTLIVIKLNGLVKERRQICNVRAVVQNHQGWHRRSPWRLITQMLHFIFLGLTVSHGNYYINLWTVLVMRFCLLVLNQMWALCINLLPQLSFLFFTPMQLLYRLLSLYCSWRIMNLHSWSIAFLVKWKLILRDVDSWVVVPIFHSNPWNFSLITSIHFTILPINVITIHITLQ